MMNVEKQEAFLAALERHLGLVLSTPFLFAVVLVVLYYLGDSEIRRLVDFLTFGK